MTIAKTTNYRFSTAYRKSPIDVRFHQSYTKIPNGCWNWLGATSFKGRKWSYGIINKDKKPYLAHRVSWELHNGPIPKEMDLCHKCDNTLCVNPDHLFLGTQADNNRDRDLKGRKAMGEGHGKYIHGKFVNQARWRTRPDGSRYYFSGN